ncbi:MAG: hypothetical protein AAF493_06500 [Pseudomonadota bacterium]
MAHDDHNEPTEGLSKRQRLFVRYLIAVLLNLAVLGLIAEWFRYVEATSFSVLLLTSIVLQVLLKSTIALEHGVVAFWRRRPGKAAKVLQISCAWLVLFGSKFAMLGAISLIFDDRIVFSGPMNGVAAFVATVIALLVCERFVTWTYRTLR